MADVICVTCGVQYGGRPTRCPVCQDERQYVGWDGQRWTTLSEMRAGGAYRNVLAEEGPGLVGIGTEPQFAIGQRALLVGPVGVGGGDGNVLWDCISYLDDATVAAVEARGGLAAIAVSHPHYYATMLEWSRAFGDVPVYVHAADERWLGRRDGAVVAWSGETLEIGPGLTLLNLGIHFAGGTVLHWAEGEDGRGALLSGDILQVVMDRRWVSFMRSYPNLIPERPEVVDRARAVLSGWRFASIYGAWWGRVVRDEGEAALARSVARYLEQVGWTPGAPA